MALAHLATMATMPGRVASFRAAAASISPQVDEVHVHFNAYSSAAMGDALAGLPDNVAGVCSEDNLGDQEKFLVTSGAEGWRIVCDDDLVYPPDFVDRMTFWSSSTGGPVSALGVTLRSPFYDLARSCAMHHFARAVDLAPVDLLGTGVLCCRASDAPFTRADFPEPNMADVWASIAWRRRGLCLHVAPHDAGWVVASNPRATGGTIWSEGLRGTGSFLDTRAAQSRVIREHADLFGLVIA